MGNCQTVGPEEALVVTGRCCGSGNSTRYIIGGLGWYWCCVSETQLLSLEIMTLLPNVKICESKKGVPVTVTGVAQVKVMAEDNNYLAIACEQFLGKTREEICALLLETFEGHLRAIVGTMDVEELFRDREEFARNVREMAATDVSKMGIKILSFAIKDLHDGEGYLDAIGQEQTAIVKSKAIIERAEADRDAFIQEQECQKLSMDTKYKTDTQVADFRREHETNLANYATVVNTAQAASELAYELQVSKELQVIVSEELNVDLVEKQLAIKVEEQEIIRADKELTGTTRLPADAEAFKTTILAEGRRLERLRAAEGEGQRIRLLGGAQALAIEAVGKAQALEMDLKAQAYKEYGNAAVMRLVLNAMPKLAAEVAAPLNCVDEIVIVSSGSGSGDGITAGASKLLSEIPASVKALTGFGLGAGLSSMLGKSPDADQ